MKVFRVFSLFAACAFGGLILSTLLTFVAWNIQIEPRAFQCWDSMGMLFDNYWEDMDTHRGAGDRISAGWTWDEIKTAREIYILAFFGIWAASSLVSFRLISRGPRHPNNAVGPQAIETPETTT